MLYKTILLLIFNIILSYNIINCSLPPSIVVNVLNNSTQFELQYFDLLTGNSISNVSVPNESAVAIASIDNYSVTYISQDSNGFFFNMYDISSKTIKVLSSINYSNDTYDIAYSFQQINSNSPSLDNQFTLLGKNSSNYLFFLNLDFEKTIFTLGEASTKSVSDNTYYNGGYDYYSSTYYYTYMDDSFCNNFGSFNSSLEPEITEACIDNAVSFQDRTVPIMYNSTSYLITADGDSNEVDITLFAVYDEGAITIIDKLEIFSFYNVANVPHYSYQPINFVSISNEYVTIALYSALGKYQYITINLNNYYMTSVLTNRSNKLDLIYAF